METEFEARMRGSAGTEQSKGGIRVMQLEDIADSVLYILGAPPHVQITTLVIETTDPWP